MSGRRWQVLSLGFPKRSPFRKDLGVGVRVAGTGSTAHIGVFLRDTGKLALHGLSVREAVSCPGRCSSFILPVWLPGPGEGETGPGQV